MSQFKSISTKPAHVETLAMPPTPTTLATALDQARTQIILRSTQAFAAAWTQLQMQPGTSTAAVPSLNAQQFLNQIKVTNHKETTQAEAPNRPNKNAHRMPLAAAWTLQYQIGPPWTVPAYKDQMAKTKLVSYLTLLTALARL